MKDKKSNRYKCWIRKGLLLIETISEIKITQIIHLIYNIVKKIAFK